MIAHPQATATRVLLLEDNPADAELIRRELRKLSFPVETRWVVTPDEYTSALREFAPEIILSDHSVPAFSGRAALDLAREIVPGVPLILVTASLDEESAVEYMKAGAADYVIKDRLLRLGPSVQLALESARSIRESENRYRTLFIGVPVGLFRIGLKGEVLAANPALATLLGYDSPETLTAAGLAGHEVDPTDRMWWRQRLDQSGSIEGFEMRLRRRDGREIWVRESARAVRGVSGVIEFYEGTVEDVTQQKAAEEDLRDREALFSSLANSAPVAIFRANPEGRTTYVTPRWTEISGMSMDATVKKGWTQAVHADDRTDASEAWQVAVDAERSYEAELRLVRPDQQGRTVIVHAAPMRGSDGVLLGYVGTVEDVTVRKNLEEQFRHAQKMEGVGQLAGGIAHDFNNLLTVISSYAGMLAQSLPDEDERQEDIAAISAAAARSAELTRQLLAFSRQQVLQPRVLDLNDVISGVRKILGRLLREDIEFATSLKPNLGLVRADPGQLEQVIVNLAVNARDAMPNGGQLTIETGNAELDNSYADAHHPMTAGRYSMMAVTDTGVGMTPEVQRRIFEPFFTTKETGKGTGLGLATVYGIVKQSDGYVWVYSEPGHGTTFKIYLPQVQGNADHSAIHPEANKPIVGGHETILLVEDEESVRRLALRVLEALGYTVLTAANGELGLEMVARHGDEIAMILTDVVMPKLAGHELAARVKGTHPQCRVLFMSGYAPDAVVRHRVLDEGTAFLPKPFTPAELGRKVREVLDATEP